MVEKNNIGKEVYKIFLKQIKPSDLDIYERQVYDDFRSKGVSHCTCLELLINQVEGDDTQLSTELAKAFKYSNWNEN